MDEQNQIPNSKTIEPGSEKKASGAADGDGFEEALTANTAKNLTNPVGLKAITNGCNISNPDDNDGESGEEAGAEGEF